MLFTQQWNDDEEYEDIELTIGQWVNYCDDSENEKSGEIIAVNLLTGYINILTGGIIKYTDCVHVDDLIIEG